PITARLSLRSMRFTPARAISAPPMPVSEYAAFRDINSRATPAACRSPDASPATKRISRTTMHGLLRRRPHVADGSVDVLHNGERHRQRIPAVLTGHRD